MEFEAEFNGELSLSEKNKLSQWYLKEINAKTVSDRKDSDIYTIYAYTKYIRLEEIVNQNNDNMLCRHLIDKNFSGLEKYVDKKISKTSCFKI